MLRVEYNDPKKCEGVASYIRYWEVAMAYVDLPNINDINDDELLKARRINDLRQPPREEVRAYMQQGFITDFKLIKKMHRKARHFYGTVIQHKNGIWGVLLADSISETSPFDDITQQRFNSFATTINGIINMEV